MQLHADEYDEAVMAMSHCKHPEFVQAEMKFYAARDAKKNKKKV
jgi:hypothetical protein